ncbi:hypothetical protein FRX31_020454 [Thalictrum thalictroides]|uniref:Uncharacterized protein n=1 Tax=Thalictrum thalictroides TaxID=46969 RepID=A0A7J6VXX5_THATH|nr:hypothetical protein FRX31_020454 [Thalictrum thalictroides]
MMHIIIRKRTRSMVANTPTPSNPINMQRSRTKVQDRRFHSSPIPVQGNRTINHNIRVRRALFQEPTNVESNYIPRRIDVNEYENMFQQYDPGE